MQVVHAPIPDLQIVDVTRLHPHEEHDSQRSQPLVENLRHAQYLLNPPIIAPIHGVGEVDRAEQEYVILDGANRCFAFRDLEYPHILAQVVSYESGTVALDVWHHIVSRWQPESLLEQVARIETVQVSPGYDDAAIAHILLRDGQGYAVTSRAEDLPGRNADLRQVVRVYQQHAVLDRTAISEPHQVLPLYPEAIALVVFPHYHPRDILEAARQSAYLPPGISRHVVHGRAIRVNFPVEILRDAHASLGDKNETLSVWIEQKFARRQVRYYAEATYQFDE
jgi:hypothetical protein